jgi:hypothetical protein
MKRFAIVGVLILMAAALGFWWMVPKQAGEDRLISRPPSDEKSTSFSFKMEGGEVDYNGKKTSFVIRGEEAKDVEVKIGPAIKFKDDQSDATFQVTIKIEQPSILTKEAYEKIQNGMTYPQVGEVLGRAMTKGKMSDGFSSKLQLIQGKHQIDLTFVDGKVTEKSAKDLE